jgi:CBS domain-containing protein
MAPFSYQPPTRGDKADKHSYSQSADSALSQGQSTVSNLLDKKGNAVHTIRPADTVAHAVEVLRDKHIGALLVTDQNGALQGILSERDIVRRMAETPGQTLPQQVSDLMTHDVKSCTPDDTLMEVLEVMNAGRFRHMPVTQNDTLCGMVTIGDVVNFRLQELEYEALRMKQMIVG